MYVRYISTMPSQLILFFNPIYNVSGVTFKVESYRNAPTRNSFGTTAYYLEFKIKIIDVPDDLVGIPFSLTNLMGDPLGNNSYHINGFQLDFEG